jgi:hypothetical protein
MKRHDNRKKKLIISNENLSDELRELFKEAYPEGHKDYMQKIVKPDGTPIFVVPLETEDTSYMVKFEVRIDSHLAEEELDKELFADDDIKDETSKFEPLTDDPSEKHDPDHKEFDLKHGAYEDAFDIPDDEEEEDEYEEKDDYIDEDDEDDEDDEYMTDYDDGPNDADIMDIENFMKESNIGADEKPEKPMGKAKAKKEPKAKKETKAKKEPKATKTAKKEPKSTKTKTK